MSKSRLKMLFTLFISFFKIGAFTFGGGYAMISLFENEFVSKKKWIDDKEFLDIAAIAESTPGPIAINSATYIGYKMAGVLGSAAATLGVVLPSLIIIYVISLFFDKFLSFKYVKYAFKGIEAAIIYLIGSAAVKMYKSLDKTLFNRIVLICVLALMLCLSVFEISFSSIYVILICGAIGIVSYLLGLKKGGDKK